MLLRQEFDPVAEEYAQKAAALDPRLPGAHLLLGELLLYKSRLPEATRAIPERTQRQSGERDYSLQTATGIRRIQKYDGRGAASAALNLLDATFHRAIHSDGKVLSKKGEFRTGREGLAARCGMDPNNPMTHHLLGPDLS